MKNKRLQDQLTVAAFTVGLVFLFYHWADVANSLSNLVSILTPFVLGFILAYLLKRPFRLFRRLYHPMVGRLGERGEGLEKGLALATTYLALVLALSAFFSIIIPQLVSSIMALVEGMPVYLIQFEGMVTGWMSQYSLDTALFDWLNQYWNELLEVFTKFISNLAPVLMEAAKGITSGVVNVFIGLVVSVYMLLGAETLTQQVKRGLFAVLPSRWARRVLEVGRLSDKTFGSFIGGQMTVSLILGTLCAIAMGILRMPYALLSGVIVGITNMIPYFGPFLGAVPCTFFILVQSPMKAVWFVALILVLQQVDNNFISPRIVGGSVGLSGIWVLFAITIGGSLFGIPGMVMGLPTFAVLYTLVGEWVRHRLEQKQAAGTLCAAGLELEKGGEEIR